MTDQLELVPDGPKLTPRQQAALDYIAAHDGVPADEIGAAWHELRGKHPCGDRCEWCDPDGKSVVRSKALKPLVTSRRGRGEGRLYVLRGSQRTEPDTSHTQLDGLPGDSFEDVFACQVDESAGLREDTA